MKYRIVKQINKQLQTVNYIPQFYEETFLNLVFKWFDMNKGWQNFYTIGVSQFDETVIEFSALVRCEEYLKKEKEENDKRINDKKITEEIIDYY